MDFGKESQPGPARIGFPFKLEHVDSFIGNMEIFLNKLDDDIRMLPGVDKNGNSECPFAEQLYVQKEESASKVVEEGSVPKTFKLMVSVVFFPNGRVVWIKSSFSSWTLLFLLDWFRSHP